MWGEAIKVKRVVKWAKAAANAGVLLSPTVHWPYRRYYSNLAVVQTLYPDAVLLEVASPDDLDPVELPE